MVSVLILCGWGSPRNTESTRFTFVHSQVKKSRYLLWGREFYTRWCYHFGSWDTSGTFGGSWHLQRCDSFLFHQQSWVNYGSLAGMNTFRLHVNTTCICHGIEWISSMWSTPTSTALLDTGWNTHFYYELRVMCQQLSMLQCCSVLKGTAAERSQFNTVLEIRISWKTPLKDTGKSF